MKYSNKRAKQELDAKDNAPTGDFMKVVIPKQKTDAEKGREEAIKYCRMVMVQNAIGF
jgi:hypothetical protein